MSKQQYTVLSPDGFDIRLHTWDTKEEAHLALTIWMERYEAQGYYSSNAGRIPLNELESRCTIKRI
tara:strand:+ start:60 stop:257 length:198 start_codon:yes stop_codon:yes gene_type:complete